MTIRSADPQTIAPRLSYVEDAVQHLLDHPSGGGSDPSVLLQKLWRATMDGAETTATTSPDPWTKTTTLIYNIPTKPSLHSTVFGADPADAIRCQDGYGFYGHVFPSGDQTWSYGTPNRRSLAEDAFKDGPSIGSFRTKGLSLSKSIWWNDASKLGTTRASSIIGRIEQLVSDLEELATNAETQLQSIYQELSADIARVEARLDAHIDAS